MSRTSLSADAPSAWGFPAWLPTVLLLGGTALVGPSLGAAIRPLFVVGCAVAGWAAWRKDPAAHLQSVLAMFCFSPFLRRLTDVGIGFDAGSLMLVAPLLAIAVTGVDLPSRPASPSRETERGSVGVPAQPCSGADDGHRARRPPGILVPLAVVAACICYEGLISIVRGDWNDAASGLLKHGAPLIYATALVRCRTSSAALLSAAASAFLVILPIMGVYGIVQYVDPPAWDRFWMNYATILSAGQPVPYGIRTYSTMHGPASFATFAAAGLLVVCFLRSGWRPLVCVALSAPALLLSSYRTAWISLLVGVVFCCLFQATRFRAVAALCGGAVALVLTALLTPFGTVITDRIATFGNGAQDVSAQERLSEFATLWTQWDSGLLGSGFTTFDAGNPGAMPVDGMVIMCWLGMGIVVGLLCLAALVWAIANAVSAAVRDGRREAVVAGALACGALTQMPLASIVTGELGFLFWTFVVLLPASSTEGALVR